MSELNDIVIIGAGGLGREVLALIEACNRTKREWNVTGFLDANPKLAGKSVNGVPVLGDDEWTRNNVSRPVSFVCAIGSSRVRRSIEEKVSSLGCRFATLVHPDVRIPQSVRIGPGSVIMAGTQFTTDARVGSHVVVYINCSITHDVEIGDYCMLGPGCNLSGAVVVETGVHLGTGVNILPQRRIGAWATIGAGSVVIDDIPPNSTAAGTPCRVIRK